MSRVYVNKNNVPVSNFNKKISLSFTIINIVENSIQKSTQNSKYGCVLNEKN